MMKEMVQAHDVLRVVIVSSADLYAQGVEHALKDGPGAPRCRIISGEKFATFSSSRNGRGFLLIPRSWQEMKRWLDGRRDARHAKRIDDPCALMVEVPVAAIFLDWFTGRCAVATPGTCAEEVRTILRSVAGHGGVSAAEQVRVAFNSGLHALPADERTEHWTLREVQCGCATWLGLNDEEMDENLFIEACARRTHVDSIHQKLRRVKEANQVPAHLLRVNRAEVAAHVGEILQPGRVLH